MKTRIPKAWRTQYWTFWGRTICSKHETFAAAAKAVLACERRGGVRHTIYRVEKKR